MSQQVSQTVQERIDELVQRTREKEEERKKKKAALLVGKTAGTSQGCTSKSDKGQETTTTVSVAERTIMIEHIDKGDESMEAKKMDDESGQEKEVDVEKQEEVDVEGHGKITDEPGDETTNDSEPENEPSMVEFEDPVYELSQTYEMESEYESMTVEQETAKVRALSPTGQAEYRELTRLHQRQADMDKRITGISKIIEERTKAQTPGLLVDLIKRSVQVGPAGRQEVHRMTEKHKTWTQIKPDKIPRTNKPGTSQGYYLFMEDDAGCMIEQQSGQAI